MQVNFGVDIKIEICIQQFDGQQAWNRGSGTAGTASDNMSAQCGSTGDYRAPGYRCIQAGSTLPASFCTTTPRMCSGRARKSSTTITSTSSRSGGERLATAMHKDAKPAPWCTAVWGLGNAQAWVYGIGKDQRYDKSCA